MSAPGRFDEDYLYDGSGRPDAETERLERLLGTQRYQPAEDTARVPARRVLRFVLASAAAVLLVFTATIAWRAGRGGYVVEGLAGIARVAVGDELVTDGSTEAWIEVANLGGVTVRPGSRLRIDDKDDEAHRFYLERGSIHARILARPRLFQVGTPAGLTVDLGCEYDLEVDDAGVAHLAVQTGRVAFETAGRKVLVPARASCEAQPGRGPDTPCFFDADAEFVRALREVEFDPAPDQDSVQRLIDTARREDSLSLWHLLDAPSPAVREAVHAKLASLAPVPPEATRERLLAGDETLRAAWRRELESDWRWH